MSDRGMWVMNDTKRCSGYKGHWECADQHPDHIVPFSEFAVDTCSIDGLQNKCRLCQSYYNHIQFTTQRPRHPITSEAKQNWKSRKAIELGVCLIQHNGNHSLIALRYNGTRILKLTYLIQRQQKKCWSLCQSLVNQNQ